MNLLKPLCIIDIGLTSRNIPYVTSIYKVDFQASIAEQFIKRHPINTRGFHCHRRDAKPNQPLYEKLEIVCVAIERPRWLIIEIRGN